MRGVIVITSYSIHYTKLYEALGELAAAYFKTASHPFKLVGVTGTNGKTTVTYLIEYLLAANSLV